MYDVYPHSMLRGALAVQYNVVLCLSGLHRLSSRSEYFKPSLLYVRVTHNHWPQQPRGAITQKNWRFNPWGPSPTCFDTFPELIGFKQTTLSRVWVDYFVSLLRNFFILYVERCNDLQCTSWHISVGKHNLLSEIRIWQRVSRCVFHLCSYWPAGLVDPNESAPTWCKVCAMSSNIFLNSRAKKITTKSWCLQWGGSPLQDPCLLILLFAADHMPCCWEWIITTDWLFPEMLWCW